MSDASNVDPTPFQVAVVRDLVEVTGPDASTYLQSQVSQDLRPLMVGDSRWTFVLQPTGRVESLARVRRTAEDTFVFDTDAGFGDALFARLQRFKIRVQADLRQAVVDVHCVRGDAGGGGVDGVVAWGSGVDRFDTPAPGVRYGTTDDLLAARIAATWPAMGAEITPGETIPAETGITDIAVSFTKGCYPGQELVERMDSRAASAPRSLRRVVVPGGSSAGDPYVVDGVELGRITSVHGTDALALVKRGAQP
jgi:tRNA-modifying protein YgfZ